MKRYFLAILLTIACSFITSTVSAQNLENLTAPVLSKQVYRVTQVVDGDTIKLANGETVRLIGVDTPETVHPNKPVEKFGREASAFTKRLLQGKPVRLEFDDDTRDRYGRLLAYVYLADGRSANEQIIISGYGYAYTQFPFKYMERYRELEKAARVQRKGLWAENSASAATPPATTATPANSAESVVITPSGKKYHSATCRYVFPATAKAIPQAQAIRLVAYAGKKLGKVGTAKTFHANKSSITASGVTAWKLGYRLCVSVLIFLISFQSVA